MERSAVFRSADSESPHTRKELVRCSISQSNLLPSENGKAGLEPLEQPSQQPGTSTAPCEIYTNLF